MNLATPSIESAFRDDPLHLSELALPDGGKILVVRDDLLAGGSKQRAALPFLRDLRARGVGRVAYASPFAGFAQVALSHGCARLGIGCEIFAERDPGQAGLLPHEFTRLAARWGADVTLAPTLASATARAEASGAHVIPLGFRGPEFEAHFRRALQLCFRELLDRGQQPRRVWVPVGSGTLVRCLSAAAPLGTEFLCVDVGVLSPEDPRVAALHDLPGLQYFAAPERFAERAREPTPIPSNLHYDAKLWPFLKAYGRSGDLWWNVA